MAQRGPAATPIELTSSRPSGLFHQIGRISLHLRNGSISATALTKGASGVRCGVPFNTFIALCTDNGIAFYEGKDRRMLRESCMESHSLDEGLPELGQLLAAQSSQGICERDSLPPLTRAGGRW